MCTHVLNVKQCRIELIPIYLQLHFSSFHHAGGKFRIDKMAKISFTNTDTEEHAGMSNFAS